MENAGETEPQPGLWWKVAFGIQAPYAVFAPSAEAALALLQDEPGVALNKDNPPHIEAFPDEWEVDGLKVKAQEVLTQRFSGQTVVSFRTPSHPGGVIW